MELNPHKIYQDYTDRTIEKISAINELVLLIENSSKLSVRLESIKILEEIIKSGNNSLSIEEKIFNLFEDLLISDSNEKIRTAATHFISKFFGSQALSPLKWALQHDDSLISLEPIFNTLVKIVNNLKRTSNRESRSILLEQVNQIKEPEFKLCFEIILEKTGINILSDAEIADILLNFYSLIFLKKMFWRLKYSLDSCRITELDFIFKGLTKLPLALKHLTFLKRLTLRYNQITELPNWIGNLKNLEYLNLNVNNLNILSPSIGSIHTLKEVLLWKNELTSIPEEIGSLVNLETLNLRLNMLSELPYSIGNLSNLKELNLHDNKLTILPDSITNLASLEILNLSWNLIERLPDDIGYLSNLQVLDLERNELTGLPSSITRLNSLEILNLGDNMLEAIPSSINLLQNLRVLNLSRNEIQVLPKSLGDLKRLEEIYLGDNKFNEIPSFLTLLEEDGVRIYF